MAGGHGLNLCLYISSFYIPCISTNTMQTHIFSIQADMFPIFNGIVAFTFSLPQFEDIFVSNGHVVATFIMCAITIM
jgi:hypothetical protein